MNKREIRKQFDAISDEMLTRIANAVNKTWSAIGYDCFVDDNGRQDESRVFPRDEVWELCIDADRTQVYGDDEEATRFLYKLPWEVRNCPMMIEHCLQFKKYGW